MDEHVDFCLDRCDGRCTKGRFLSIVDLLLLSFSLILRLFVRCVVCVVCDEEGLGDGDVEVEKHVGSIWEVTHRPRCV